MKVRRIPTALSQVLAILIAILAMSLTIHAEEVSKPRVQYVKEVLIVGNTKYSADPRDPPHGPGKIIVYAVKGQAALLERTLQSLELTVEKTISSAYVVVVPISYESQWAAALRDQPGVGSAHVNAIYVPAAGAVSPNPSIERTSPGKPGAASHVKR